MRAPLHPVKRAQAPSGFTGEACALGRSVSQLSYEEVIHPVHLELLPQAVGSSREVELLEHLAGLHQRLDHLQGGCRVYVVVQLSVDDQARRLINMATDVYTLSAMYSGWCPYW